MLHRTHAHRGLERERRAGIRAVLFTRQYSQRNIAVRCKCHRSALHRPSQHAASALAAHCTRHTGRLPYSSHPLSRDCATSQLSPTTKFPNHSRLFLHSTYYISSPSLSHFKPTPLSLPNSPHHPSPSAQSSPSSPPASVRLPTRNCRFTYPPLPSSIPKTTPRLPYPAPRPATAHKKPAPNPVKIVL